MALQAEEAKTLGLEKLGAGVSDAISSYGSYEDAREPYSERQMTNDVYQDLWKVATRLFYYYDVDSLDIEKFNKIVEAASESLIEEMTKGLNKTAVLKSDVEPKLPGEE